MRHAGIDARRNSAAIGVHPQFRITAIRHDCLLEPANPQPRQRA
jgi:hypothetical protein